MRMSTPGKEKIQMQTATLDRPAAPGNTPPPEDSTAQTAGEILAESSWAVPISRPMVLLYNNPKDFPVLLAWAAVRACTDRRIHGTPPGGWARLAGMSERTWYAARRRAIELGLISASPGSSRIVPLAKLEPHQQFAKAPTKILFDQTLTRTARRIFVVLSLYRSGFGDSRVAVQTLADGSSTNSRDVRRALKELQKHYHITNMGSVGRGAVRYFLKGQTTPPAPKSSTQDAPQNPVSYPQAGTLPKGEPGNETPPPRGLSGNDTPPNPATTPPLSVDSNLDSLKRRKAPVPVDHPAPRDEQPAPMTKKEASAIIARAGLKAVGADFGKQSSGLQGQQASDSTARQLFADWSSERLKAAKRSAEASLPDANPGEAQTLKATIADYTDAMERMVTA